MPTLEPIGRVVRFYARPSAAAIRLDAPLAIGERIYVRGWTTDLQQTVASLQVNHEPVERGCAGQVVGLVMQGKCRPNDVVYRVPGPA